jgi:tRNA (guanine10-N2)-dimethyltransferase
MYALLLNGANVILAKEEIHALSNTKKTILDDRVLLINKKFDFGRLAYTQKVYKLIEIVQDIEEIKKINFQKYYKKSFRVRLIRISDNLGNDYHERSIGSMIWKKLDNPKVEMDNPGTKFSFIFTKKNIYVCLEIIDLDKTEMRLRDSKFRPGLHPSTMNSLFARALVNLSCIKKNEVFMDPFCGVGGILLEAGSLKCKLIAYDINPYIIEKCKKNLEHYKIRNFKVKVMNALEVKDRVDAIATDLPYGRHSSLHGMKIEDLYNQFTARAFLILKKKKRLVIVMPSTVNINHKGFTLKAEILNRIHKGLTRKILVLEKN